MPTIVFRFLIGSNVEQLKFDLSTVVHVFGSTLPFYSTERYKVSLNSKTHLYMWQT